MSCSPSPQAALRRALADADIAGLISEQTLQQLSADPKQLSHPELACPECGQIRKVAEGKASQAVLLHPGGCFEKLHVPLRCRRSTCKLAGVSQWHNYFAKEGRHKFSGLPSKLQCFMISSRFGITTAWLTQFHLRLLREHVSFAGEADVATALATMQGKSQLLPASLRNLISETWFKWRLCLRIERITTSSSSSTPPLDRLDLALPVEDLIRPLWPLMSEEFHAAAIAEARAAGMRCNIVVVDGNAKNRRAVCAAALTQVIADRKLNKIIRAGCPHTPQLGRTCCPQHEASRNAAQPADVEIVDHQVPATALQSASSTLIF